MFRHTQGRRAVAFTKRHIRISNRDHEPEWLIPWKIAGNVIVEDRQSAIVSAPKGEVEIIDLPQPTFSWDGVSLAGTENSVIEMDFQVGGTYKIEGNFDAGFAAIAVDPSPLAPVPTSPMTINADYEIFVDLDAGTHTFVVMQGNSATNSWAYTVTLETAYAPSITNVSPATIYSGAETTITIDGENFLDGAVVTEDVLLTILAGDEAETLLVVEPLDRTGDTHCRTPTGFRIVGVRLCCFAASFRPTRLLVLAGNPRMVGGTRVAPPISRESSAPDSLGMHPRPLSEGPPVMIGRMT